MMKFMFITTMALISVSTHSQELKICKKNFKEFNNHYYSTYYLDKLLYSINECNFLIKTWVYIDKIADTPDKIRLKEYHTNDIPELFETLDLLSNDWDSVDIESLQEIKLTTDSLFAIHKYIMNQMNSFSSYDDLFIIFDIASLLEETGSCNIVSKHILNKISLLRDRYKSRLYRYLLPLKGLPSEESVIDYKSLAVNLFIKNYNLQKLANTQKKIDSIYNYFTMQELLDATNDSVPKNAEFYKKYNTLILKLSE